jgi:hypothetical protein
MSSFQDTVLSVALFCLIITLLIIGIALYRNRASLAFPPVVADCPDYWIDSSDGNGASCKNVKNLGNTSCDKTMDFSTSNWSGNRGLCNKSRWAKSCNLTWDGITTNTNICRTSNN